MKSAKSSVTSFKSFDYSSTLSICLWMSIPLPSFLLSIFITIPPYLYKMNAYEIWNTVMKMASKKEPQYCDSNKKGAKAKAFTPILTLSVFYILLFSLRKPLIRSISRRSTNSLAPPCRVIYADSPVPTYPSSCEYGSYPAA